MLRSIARAAAAVLLCASGVTACGGDATDSTDAADGAGVQAYCNTLRDAQQEFGAVQRGDLASADLDEVVDRVDQLTRQAPDRVAKQWRTLDRGMGRLKSGLDDLGLSVADLADPEKLADVDPQKLDAFSDDVRAIGGREFQRAGRVIARHAQSACGIRVDGSSDPTQ